MLTLKNSARFAITAGILALLLSTVALASDESAQAAAEYPAISPDGTKLVFSSNENGTRDLWIANANGSNAQQLTPWADSDERHPSWSPDGTRVVFSSNRGSTKHHIWVIEVNSGNATQLTSDDAEHESPRFSPNGSIILFLSNSTGKRELWVMNADGTAQRSIALISTRISDPSWSPDGTQIVYVGCKRGAECNLFGISANGSGGFQITTGDFQDWTPDWGTPGIVFASNRGGSQGLWLVQANGTGLRQLTNPEGAADLDPRWVGNSSALVFARSGKDVGDAASDIWFLPTLDSVAKQLTTVGGPLRVKQAVLAQLIALRATVDQRQNATRLDLAITHLTKATDLTLWIDSSRLQAKGGDTVFNEEKDAVNQLRILVQDKSVTIDSSTLQSLIDRLVMADRVLASVAIADAVARNLNANDIALANAELLKGDEDRTGGKPLNAIEDYRNAWKKCVKP